MTPLNQNGPSVSVLTTLYNHAKYIEETIESALGQTLAPSEIIVIDDASTDGSLEVVRKLRHPSLRVFAEVRNLGGATTMKGLSYCTGEYVAILNSDDSWAPRKLQKQIAYLETHRECAACFTWPALIDEAGRPWSRVGQTLYSTFQKTNRNRFSWLRELFDHGNAFCASSAVVRRSCFERLGGLDGRYIQLQDFEMWTRLLTSGYDVQLLEEELTYYRVNRALTNMSVNSRSVRARQTYEYSRLLRNYWRLPTADEIFKIFPEHDDFGTSRDDALVIFYLALIASRRKAAHHKQFAADSMFEFAGNGHAMARAYDLFGFSHRHYRDFMASNPLGVREEERWRVRLRALIIWLVPPTLLQSARRLKKSIG